MPGRSRCLLDSNILLRLSRNEDPLHPAILKALRALHGANVQLCYNLQTLAEFWNVSTRPVERNGFGLTILETDRLVRMIEVNFEFLPDTKEVCDRWHSLVLELKVQGVQVHDARLAASIYVHGISSILTVNDRDFRRFEGINVRHPSEF